MDKLKGAKAIVQIKNKAVAALASTAIAAALMTGCGGTTSNSSGGGSVDPNETAAKVNGKVIAMQEVDRAVKTQTQGQESRLSPLELAGARLQVLQTLVEQEVMFQKAEKETTVPSDEDVTVEFNKRKTESGKSADQIAKDLKDSGMTEASVREALKKEMAISRLVDKVTGKIEPPKDTEIEAFYNGNKEAFVKKKGVKLAAIVIDPSNTGEGDQTTDEQSAVIRANEIIKQLQTGVDFAAVAREKSEDQSRFQGGELGYISEEDLKQNFPAQVAATLMSPEFAIGKIITSQAQGKYFILKLQERSDKDEAMTLESPGIRTQVQEELVKARKQLLASSYQAIAMNEAKIENYLARKVVENPNELSGARPAGTNPPESNGNQTIGANTNGAQSNSNAGNSNSNSNSGGSAASNSNARPAAANAVKPAASSTAKNASIPANK